MIIQKKVRRVRSTGMNKKFNKSMANIVLPNCWLGINAIVIDYETYKESKRELKKLNLLKKKIEILLKKLNATPQNANKKVM